MNKRVERLLLVVWLVVNLAIGLWLVREYGLSYDEPDYYRYADYSLAAYKSFFGRLYEPDIGFGNLQYYGPAFIVIVNAIIKILDWVSFDFVEIQVWHYAYFVTFQLTGLCLYGIVKRWFSPWTAWAALTLFITQPLLWGHAFINPKDIPFMFFFSLSVWVGFRMVDSLGRGAPILSTRDFHRSFLKRWEPVDRSKRRKFLFWLLLAVFGLALSRSFVNFAIDRVITYFYSAKADSWAGRVMMRFAEHISTIPVEEYITKAQTLYARFDFIFWVLGLSAISGYLVVLLTNTSLCVHGHRLWHRMVEQIRWQKFLSFFHSTFKALIIPKVILAGVVLGLTTAVRVLGPLAGVFVILLLWIQIRHRSYPFIMAYLLWSGVIAYIFWPYLWAAPLTNFIESLNIMSDFSWQGEVLFNGEFYSAASIPRQYLPVLLNLQFTETFIILGYLGLFFFIWQLGHKEVRVDLLLYVSFGFFLPIIYLILNRSPLYDNFRQLLFLIPALFVMVAFAFENLFQKIKQSWMRVSIILIFVFPGLLSSIQLHPYQYIYYNAFVGGVDGAFRRFELDYWLTSMSELTTWANENTEIDAKIAVKAAPYFMAQQLRSDLSVKKLGTSANTIDDEYDYAILTSRWNADEHYPNASIRAVVKKGGATLGVVKEVKGQSRE